MYVPWTGLGLFGGFRGNRWLRNRIKVFKQFVLPSLRAQTNQNFIIWFSWRREEKSNPIVQEFIQDMLNLYPEWMPEGPRVVNTFHGICFWDDKYPDLIARERLIMSLHGSLAELTDTIGECENVLMTIQPSDDCYHRNAVEALQTIFRETDAQAVGFKRGYMMNYTTKEVAEYNPTTNPPFFTIKFPRDIFIQPQRHADYTGPYKSHEYVGEKLRYSVIEERGFLVGTHGENISTVFNHPFRGEAVSPEILKDFGLYDVKPLQIRTSIKRAILRRLPFKVQRKLRYWIGERFWQSIYEFLRS